MLRFRYNNPFFFMKINSTAKIYKEACCLLENEWKIVGNNFLNG